MYATTYDESRRPIKINLVGNAEYFKQAEDLSLELWVAREEGDNRDLTMRVEMAKYADPPTLWAFPIGEELQNMNTNEVNYFISKDPDLIGERFGFTPFSFDNKRKPISVYMKTLSGLATIPYS